MCVHLSSTLEEVFLEEKNRHCAGLKKITNTDTVVIYTLDIEADSQTDGFNKQTDVQL